MRIISGKFKGRRFNPPADKWPTRPTTDFAKEGLFNILANHFDFEEISVLDLFCGTGSHTYEFVSRGCKNVTCVDKFPPCIKFVRQTLKTLEVEELVTVVQSDVFRFIKHSGVSYNYIFAGPPYPLPNLEEIPDLIFQNNMLKPGGFHVLEHNPKHDFNKHPYFTFERRYGTTIFSFFQLPDGIENSGSN